MKKEFELEKEFANKWIQALTSGKYLQGQEQLLMDNKYCCLGVACTLIDPNVNINGIGLIVEESFLELEDEGFYDKVPLLLRGHQWNNAFVSTVSGMNDSGSSFEEIANWIENNVEFV